MYTIAEMETSRTGKRSDPMGTRPLGQALPAHVRRASDEHAQDEIPNISEETFQQIRRTARAVEMKLEAEESGFALLARPPLWR